MNALEFRPSVNKADEACKRFGTVYPGDRLIQSILAQLDFLKKWDDSGGDWTDDRLKKLNFGLLASKGIDAEDRTVAQILYELANYIDENRPK